MKANELMLGDYIRIVDDDTDRSFVSKVEAIDDFGNVFFVFPGDEVAYPYSIDCCEPIPLTPEILEKNGFERCVESIVNVGDARVPLQTSNQFANEEFGGNTRIIDKRPCHGWTLQTDIFGDTDKNKIHHITYIHELQHALRLCGIEKEIEL